MWEAWEGISSVAWATLPWGQAKGPLSEDDAILGTPDSMEMGLWIILDMEYTEENRITAHEATQDEMRELLTG